MDQLRDVLAKPASSEQALRAQITAQIAWQKTVQDEYPGPHQHHARPRSTPNWQRYAEGANKPHYPGQRDFPAGGQSRPGRQGAEGRAEHRRRSSSPARNFALVARQFSQSPTAARAAISAGCMKASLPPELNAALQQDDSRRGCRRPIRSTGGYYILALRDAPGTAGHQDRQCPTERRPVRPAPCRWRACCCRWAPTPPKELVEQRHEDRRSDPRPAINGCEMLPKMPAADARRGLHGSGQHEDQRSQPRDPESAGQPPSRRSRRAVPVATPASR